MGAGRRGGAPLRSSSWVEGITSLAASASGAASAGRGRRGNSRLHVGLGRGREEELGRDMTPARGERGSSAVRS